MYSWGELSRFVGQTSLGYMKSNGGLLLYGTCTQFVVLTFTLRPLHLCHLYIKRNTINSGIFCIYLNVNEYIFSQRYICYCPLKAQICLLIALLPSELIL